MHGDKKDYDMMTQRHINAFLLLAAGLLAGCSDEASEVKPDDPTQEQRTEIAVKTHVTGMQTRATTIDNNTALQGQDLKIDAYYHGTETPYLDGVKLHYTGGVPTWRFWDGSAQLHYYWPIEGSVYNPEADPVSSLDFVGFCPFDKPTYIVTSTYDKSTGVSFTANMGDYMTLASQATMPEYLIAVLPEQTEATQTAAGGALPLTFKHPFALIKFVITAESGTNVKINRISIDDLYTGGTCTYDGTTLSWASQSGSAAMTLTEELKNGGTTEGTPFMVIPNNYGSKTLTVNATWDDWSDVTTDVSASVSFDWEAGKSYTYNLTLSKYALKVDTEKFTEQW